MQKKEIAKLFSEFMTSYDEGAKTSVWEEHSQTFRDFWNKRLLNPDEKEINESEADQIIKILDRHAKGNTKKDEAVANVMIPQGVWRRMFKEIKDNNKLHDLLNKIFLENDDNQRVILIDELYRINEGKKNSLTGESGTAINTFLYVFNPSKNITVVSLNDRRKVIEYFHFIDTIDFDNATQGKKIVLSNRAIIDGFKSLEINATPRTISVFLYKKPLREFWAQGKKTDNNITKSDLILLNHKKQIILYGPPGTGKTYATKRMAVDFIEHVNILRDLIEYEELSSTNGDQEIREVDSILFNKLKNMISTLLEVEEVPRNSMAGYYSISKITNKRRGLVWIEYPSPTTGFFPVHLRKENNTNKYPQEILNQLANYRSNGWGGYPVFTVKNEGDVENAMELIGYAYENL